MMNEMKEKNVTRYMTDVDGVLLLWVPEFLRYLRNVHGFKNLPTVQHDYNMAKSLGVTTERFGELAAEFNRSAWISNLGPLRDSVKYIRKMYEEQGIRWTVITALGPHTAARKLRDINLANVFGAEVFEEIIYTNTAEEKAAVLDHFAHEECVWVEDYPNNAILGIERGMTTYLIDQSYNKEFDHDQVQRVKNWKQIYEEIC